jgi:hypothetical protein
MVEAIVQGSKGEIVGPQGPIGNLVLWCLFKGAHIERTGARRKLCWGEAMAGIREVRVTITNGKIATLKVEHEDGTTQLIVADQLPLPSPVEPAAAKVHVANQLNKLSADLQHIEPDHVIIEWQTE